MNGLILLKRWWPGFRRRRRQFLVDGRRMRDLSESDVMLTVIDLGFGDELWANASPGFAIDMEWFVPEQGVLLTYPRTMAVAIRAAEARGVQVHRVMVKF